MKNIIVGIDFSEGSLNAMQHAVSISAKFGSKLTLLFVVSPDAKIIVGEDEKNKANIVSYVDERLKKLTDDCKKALPNSVVTHKIRIGKTSREINAEAREQGDDTLIVLGTHGCSGFQEFFIGSSAFKTISGSSHPVLSVRAGVDIHRDLTDILVVIDDTLETLQKIKQAALLAKIFQAKVHIMGLYPSKFIEIRQTIEAYVNRAEIYLMENNVRFETVYVKNMSKVETVLKYATSKNINLIIVMKEVELDGDNVFIMAPFSERIVNRSPIPILTVNVDESIYPKV